MTGFARAGGLSGACSWTWEAKSVNGKGLDIRLRLPPGFEGLEAAARKRVAAHVRRGNLTLSLTVKWTRADGGYRLNTGALEQIIAILPEIRERLPDAAAPTIDGLLGLRGVIEAADEDIGDEERQIVEADILKGLEDALHSLGIMRGEEGTRLAAVLAAHLDNIGEFCTRAGSLAAAQPGLIRERLETQVAALLEAVPALPEERLAQEAAVLMTKADVSEELDRLEAHRQAALDLMDEDAAIGRRLDFLCQEFNREANTLCSKSADVELTRVGLDLKAAIEQFREQVQNIE
jgi:uncharacterized protein (TIGR00255 family)